ncbi:MAG TPA: PilZ domain-containing protein [Sphingomicrobium sp.]|nr:PilZ domain-containing protein [Sphingomicrobium sp.]
MKSRTKPREERRSVVLPARMRAGGGWDDVCILNLSQRGLMIHSSSPAQPGSYVEIRRGAQEIVARVVWRTNNRMGLLSQRRLQVAQVISGKELPSLQRAADTLGLERRRLLRTANRNRVRARLAQFVAVGLLGAALASAAYAAVVESLGRSLSEVAFALGGG